MSYRPWLLLAMFMVMIVIIPASAHALTAETIIEGLSAPVRLTAPAGDDRLFVVEQNGLIRVYSREGVARGVFLDITHLTSQSGERGLLGLAFAPDYPESGRFFINYTDNSGDTQVVRYHVSTGNPDRAKEDSASPVLSVDQPYGNHNGGHLEFGPDGMLYIGLGDGGSGGDPQNRSQNPEVLLGKMLRIDVSGSSGYTIPDDNPFPSGPERPEIWALGLRNPWCFGFDRSTGDLYIADVGQNSIEEIDIQPAETPGGLNYGWRLMEGSQCYNPPTDCNDGSLTLPVHEYPLGGSPYRCSISGGYVHRGELAPELTGRYLYSDYCSNQVWSLSWTADQGLGTVIDHTGELDPTGEFENVASIGQDGLGELYVVDLGGRRIYRIQGETSAVILPEAPAALEQNAPNPFNPRTTIGYAVRQDDTMVTLTVHDTAGHVVQTIVNGNRSAGRHLATWDGQLASGQPAPAGIYHYRLQTPDFETTRSMALIK